MVSFNSRIVRSGCTSTVQPAPLRASSTLMFMAIARMLLALRIQEVSAWAKKYTNHLQKTNVHKKIHRTDVLDECGNSPGQKNQSECWHRHIGTINHFLVRPSFPQNVWNRMSFNAPFLWYTMQVYYDYTSNFFASKTGWCHLFPVSMTRLDLRYVLVYDIICHGRQASLMQLLSELAFLSPEMPSHQKIDGSNPNQNGDDLLKWHVHCMYTVCTPYLKPWGVWAFPTSCRFWSIPLAAIPHLYAKNAKNGFTSGYVRMDSSNISQLKW